MRKREDFDVFVSIILRAQETQGVKKNSLSERAINFDQGVASDQFILSKMHMLNLKWLEVLITFGTVSFSY